MASSRRTFAAVSSTTRTLGWEPGAGVMKRPASSRLPGRVKCRAWQHDLELAPPLRQSVNGHAATVQLDQSLDERQADSRSFGDAVRQQLRTLPERLEDGMALLREHTDPGVAHGEHELVVATLGRQL